MQRGITSQFRMGPGDVVVGPAENTRDRDGSTLLIVMVLLGMLSLIGFLFYTFAAQERSSAAYWADAQKNYTAELDPDALFDWGLSQLILGPDASLTQSALAGGRHSLLPNLFGRDIHPYNSAGIRLMSINGQPFVDMNFNNIDDGTDGTTLGNTPLEFNDSAVVNSTAAYAAARDFTNWPDPGVDYTYPDINNLFLAYKGYAVDANGNTVQVIIPSFHRPQLLRGAGGVPAATWYNDPTYAGRVLRPHPSHTNPDGNPRFPSAPVGTLTAAFPFGPDGTNPNRGQQGVWSLAGAWSIGAAAPIEWDVDNDGDGIKEGVWLDLQYPVQTTSAGEKFVPLISYTIYDADGLFNLNAHGNLSGMTRMAANSQTTIGDVRFPSHFLSVSNQGLSPSEVNPQWAFNAYPQIGVDFSGTPTDLDNATQQYLYQYGFRPVDNRQTSNFDWYRLMTGAANFQSATTYNDLYPGRYGEATSVLHPAFQFGIANGSIAATPLVQMPFPGQTGVDDNWNLVEGQYGWEVASSTPGFSAGGGGVINYVPPSTSSGLPKFYPAAVSMFASHAYGQPLDFKGDGTIVQPSTNGEARVFLSNPALAPLASMKYPQYVGFDNYGGRSDAALPLIPALPRPTISAGWWPNWLSGQQMIGWDGLPYFTGAGQGPLTAYQTDEDAETIVDPAYASRNDSIFDYSENAAWHLSPTDRTKLSLGSRSRTLAPFSLQSNLRADTSPSSPGDGISKRLTTASNDRKQHAYAGDAIHRTWEVSTGTFPPAFGAVGTYNQFDPLRPSVRKLLELTVGNMTDFAKKQFRLSLNHLTTTDTATNTPHATSNHASEGVGNIIQRPVTPHDPNLTIAQVSLATSVQEVRARLDRQQMARDIYVMLYLLGGGLDFNAQSGHVAAIGGSGYLGDNSLRNLYDDRQLREMAQFAVNVVDALDPDQIMTKFEYDKNLGNGWGDGLTVIDDDPYTEDFARYLTTDGKFNAEYPEDSDERGVVYGIEAQGLTFSEVMAFKAAQVTVAGIPDDFPSTAHDDKRDRFFTFIELRNVSTEALELARGQYRIRALTGPLGTEGKTGSIERRLQLKGGLVMPGNLFTIGNAGETDGAAPAANIDPDTPMANRPAPPDDLNHSRFRVDLANDQSGGHDFTVSSTWIAPRQMFLSPVGVPSGLDLIVDRDSGNFVLTDFNNTPYDDTDDVDITSGASERVGGFLNGTTVLNITDPVTFILERRQYPDRPQPNDTDAAQQADNPWVPVDIFRFTNLPELMLDKTNDTMASQIQTKVQAVQSRERTEPFRRPTETDTTPHVIVPLAQLYSTLMNENQSSAATFAVRQETFDRPFASPVELFRIPLYGPRNVTQWTYHAAMSPRTQAKDFHDQAATLSTVPRAATAAGKILQPEDFSNVLAAPGAKVPVNDNRWYRLFEFFEVPTRTHRQLGNPLDIVRTPGKVNVNIIRHPDVLAGLLDDQDVMSLLYMHTARPILGAMNGSDADGYMQPSSQNSGVTPVRDWWVQFLKARDGRRGYNAGDVDANGNPVVRMFPDGVTGLFLPGLADSSPFRSFASLGFTRVNGTFESPETALDQTLFRRLPFDLSQQPTTGNPDTDAGFKVRHLWQVGTAADQQGAGPTAPEPVMADRLLSKIYNNTTNRSHVFLVFVSVKFFQADDTAGAANVRIGGPLTTTPTYRGFFVIDRSNPEEAYDVASGQFTNFRSLIKYRLRID